MGPLSNRDNILFRKPCPPKLKPFIDCELCSKYEEKRSWAKININGRIERRGLWNGLLYVINPKENEKVNNNLERSLRIT